MLTNACACVCARAVLMPLSANSIISVISENVSIIEFSPSYGFHFHAYLHNWSFGWMPGIVNFNVIGCCVALRSVGFWSSTQYYYLKSE